MNGDVSLVEEGSIANVLAIMLGQKSEVPHWAAAARAVRYLKRRFQQIQSAPARPKITWRIIYDLDGGPLFIVSSTPDRPLQAAVISRARSSRSTTPNSPRSAPRRQAAARPRPPRIGILRVLDIGLRLGRARPLHGRGSPAPT